MARYLRRTISVFLLATTMAFAFSGCSLLFGGIYALRTGRVGWLVVAGIYQGIKVIRYVAISAAESMAQGEVEEHFSPEQQYYIGRGVSASLVDTYKQADLKDPKIKRQIEYLNQMAGYISVTNPDGDALWAGVHVGILETDQVAAFATPGGFVWLTRGTLNLVKSEDELAAVICHELGHVAHGHAIKSYIKDGGGRVKPNPWIKNLGMVTPLPRASGQFFGGLAKRIAENKYGPDQEIEADQWGTYALTVSGYDPKAMVRMLKRVKAWQKKHPKRGDYLKHHPKVDDRIDRIKDLIDDAEELQVKIHDEERRKQAKRYKKVFR